jgi:hypothetical protein
MCGNGQQASELEKHCARDKMIIMGLARRRAPSSGSRAGRRLYALAVVRRVTLRDKLASYPLAAGGR